MDLKGKLVAITGAGRGIGQTMARVFAAKGASVALLDLDERALQASRELCEAAGASARGYACNVAREEEVERTLDAVVRDFGRLDVMINNAGILKDALLVKAEDRTVLGKMSLKQWQAVIDVNLTGVFLCGREAAQRMVQLGNGGVIINVSSIARAGNKGQTNYAAAKAGVAAMTVCWAKELARYGIRAGTIAPGFTETEILQAMKPDILAKALQPVPLQRLGKPEEIAHGAVFIAENDFFTGRTLELDGGLRF